MYAWNWGEGDRNTGEMQWTMECNLVNFQGRNKKSKVHGERGKEQTAEHADNFSIGHLCSHVTLNTPLDNLKQRDAASETQAGCF